MELPVCFVLTGDLLLTAILVSELFIEEPDRAILGRAAIKGTLTLDFHALRLQRRARTVGSPSVVSVAAKIASGRK